VKESQLWQEYVHRLVEVLLKSEVKLVVCQKVFDYALRLKLWSEHGVLVQDQVSVHHVDRFLKLSGAENKHDTVMALDNFSDVRHVGICKSIEVVYFGDDPYISFGSDNYCTLIVYNDIPEFITYKIVIESVFEEFKVML